MSIKLGDMVRDAITGFTGVAIARHEYLYGCVRVTVQPTELREGKPIDSQTFDEPQVAVVGGSILDVAPKTAKPGGPRDEPRRTPVPSR